MPLTGAMAAALSTISVILPEGGNDGKKDGRTDPLAKQGKGAVFGMGLDRWLIDILCRLSNL